MTLPSLIADNSRALMGRIATATPPGCFVEVGVYKGGSALTLYEIAQAQGRALYLYDTFAGIPCRDDVDHHRIGDFGDIDEASMAAMRAAMPKAIFVVGEFPLSLVRMPPIAFVHADADQYQSTRDICLTLGPRMVEGGAMLFDDYSCLAGCIKAVDECFPARQILEDQRALVRF